MTSNWLGHAHMPSSWHVAVFGQFGTSDPLIMLPYKFFSKGNVLLLLTVISGLSQPTVGMCCTDTCTCTCMYKMSLYFVYC